MRYSTSWFDDEGVGENVVLFIHGHPFNRSMWRGQAAAVAAAGWRAITPDLRGYGAHPSQPSPVTLDQFADDLVDLLDQLDIGQVVLCGLSMGGQIAMAFAENHPDRVRGLILAATFPRAETADSRLVRYQVADRIEAEGMASLAEALLPMMMASDSLIRHPQTAASVLEMMRSTPPQGAAAALRGRAERPDYTEALRRFRKPALIVVGDQDAYTTQADAQAMADALPTSTLVWLPGIGHMPNLEAVAAFDDALLTFLRRVADGAAS